MKLKQIIGSSVVAALLAAGLATAHAEDSVVAKAKLSKSDAEKIALEKVPGGTIKEGELEMEGGVLLWSFDVAKPGTKDITEVNINAVTGKVIAVDVESPSAEAKEAKEEAKEKKEGKGEKEKDNDDKK
jgi:hypothetical protein